MTNEKKVLIVDDEPDVLKTLEKRLSNRGYTIIKATSGEEAVDAAKREKPDLIVMDIVMPGMDGGEAANILRLNPSTKDIPIIFLTCMLTKGEEDVSQHEIAGNFFLAKPYNVDELLSEIDKHLKG